MVGGVSINMVTKDAGNKWSGDVRYNFSNGCASQIRAGLPESDNLQRHARPAATLLGNPTQTTYDFNVAGGGALIKDRFWVNGTYPQAGSSTSWSTPGTPTAPGARRQRR